MSSAEDSWTRLFNRYLSDLSRVAKMFSAAKTPAELRNLSHDPKFLKLADAIALKMVSEGNTESARTWREAARKSGKGAMFYRELQKELQGPVGAAIRHATYENASLIKTLPLKLARQASAYIAQRGQEGIRAEQVTKELRAWFPHVAEYRLKLIARTQLAKTNTELTRARSEQLGLDWFQWSTVGINSGPHKVRDSHQNMENVLVNWHDLPAPEELIGLPSQGHYFPGGTYNCRCSALSVVSLDEIKWSARVYRNGAITTMSRAAFRKLYERPMAA